MRPTPIKILAALFLPVLMTACSSSSTERAGSSSSTQPAGSDAPSPRETGTVVSFGTPSPTASPSLPVAASYVVRAKQGVTREQLNDALTSIGRLPGVLSATLNANRTLRVNLQPQATEMDRAAILKAMSALGIVSLH